MKILKAVLGILLYFILFSLGLWVIYVIDGVILKFRNIDIQMASWTNGLLTALLWVYGKELYADWRKRKKRK